MRKNDKLQDKKVTMKDIQKERKTARNKVTSADMMKDSVKDLKKAGAKNKKNIKGKKFTNKLLKKNRLLILLKFLKFYHLSLLLM